MNSLSLIALFHQKWLNTSKAVNFQREMRLFFGSEEVFVIKNWFVLVSAFRDKVEKSKWPEYYACLSLVMYKWTQKPEISGVNFINVFDKAFTCTDPKSVKRYWRLNWNFTLSGSVRGKAASGTLMKLTPDKEMKPNFSEFVGYILDENEKGNQLDMHWIPVYKFCNPCQVKFDVYIEQGWPKCGPPKIFCSPCAKFWVHN